MTRKWLIEASSKYEYLLEEFESKINDLEVGDSSTRHARMKNITITIEEVSEPEAVDEASK